jgi:preprotein translocase subunit SecA
LFAALESPFGTVRAVFSPPRSKGIIVHIQDVHGNPEAQTNISRLLRRLHSTLPIGLVALEGAFGPMDIRRFREYPRQDVIKTVADYFLRENRISGAGHALFAMEGSIPPVVGVDDKARYAANIRAYLDSTGRRDAVQTRLSRLLEKARLEKRSVFSPRLAEVDRWIESYHKGGLSLGDYLMGLGAYVPLTEFPEITLFRDAFALEKTIDFRRVEAERESILRRTAPRLTRRESSSLARAGAAYRRGDASPVRFYQELEEARRQHRIPLGDGGPWGRYLRYITLADRLDGERLFQELRGAQARAYAGLARSDRERRLIAESRTLGLARQLTDFSLTDLDLAEYEKSPFALDDLRPFEAFYREAARRDAAMAENLLKATASAGPSPVVLVTGGFHSQGIGERVEKAGFSRIVVVPTITRIESGGGISSLTVFAREKTPLAKLFDKEKLFLPPEPVPGEILHGEFAVASLGRQQATRDLDFSPRESQELFDRLLPATDRGATQARSRRVPPNAAKVFITTSKGAVVTEISLTPGGDIATMESVQASGTYAAGLFYLRVLHAIDSLAARVFRRPLSSLRQWETRRGLRNAADLKRWVQTRFAPIYELPLALILTFMPRSVRAMIARRHARSAGDWATQLDLFDVRVRRATFKALARTRTWATSGIVLGVAAGASLIAPDAGTVLRVIGIVAAALPLLVAAIGSNAAGHRRLNTDHPEFAWTVGTLRPTDHVVADINRFFHDLYREQKNIYFPRPFPGFRIDDEAGLGFSVAQTVFPFYMDEEGYVHMTTGLDRRLARDPDKDQILFEIGVHYAFKRNFEEIQKNEHSGLITPAALLDATFKGIGNGAFSVFMKYFTTVTTDENEIVEYAVRFLERYALAKGRENRNDFQALSWLKSFDETPEKKSFLSSPGRLGIFLESLSGEPPADADPAFRANSSSENLLYIHGVLHRGQDDPPGLETTQRALGDWVGNRSATALVATVARRYSAEVMRALFTRFGGDELFAILRRLEVLSRRVDVHVTSPHVNGLGQNGAALIHRIVSTLSNAPQFPVALDDFNLCVQVLNGSQGGTPAFSEALKFLEDALKGKETTETAGIVSLFKDFLEATPADAIPDYIRLFQTNDSHDMGRLIAVARRAKEKNIPLRFDPAATPLTALELVLEHSGAPQQDLDTINLLLHASHADADVQRILKGLNAGYTQDTFRQVPPVLLQFSRNTIGPLITQAEAILPADGGLPPIGSPHLGRGKHHEEDMNWLGNWTEILSDHSLFVQDLAMVIWAARRFTDVQGKCIPFQEFEDLLRGTILSLGPIYRSMPPNDPQSSELFSQARNNLFGTVIKLRQKAEDGAVVLDFLKNFETASHRMSFKNAMDLTRNLKSFVKKGRKDAILSWMDHLSSFVDAMDEGEATREINSQVNKLCFTGVKNALPAILEARIAHNREKYPEENVATLLEDIKDLDADTRKWLSDNLQAVLAKEKDAAKMEMNALKQQISATRSKSEDPLTDEVLTTRLALTRELAKRTLGIRAYPVQLASVLLFFKPSPAGIRGLAQQVNTGEGKSLIIAMTACLAALNGDPVDIITSNTYLAARDARKFRPLFMASGLSVDYVKDQSNRQSVVQANASVFNADVVYGTNYNYESLWLSEQVDQSLVRASTVDGRTVPRAYAVGILDEVDNLFLDNALQPLQIALGNSRSSLEDTRHYSLLNNFFAAMSNVGELTENGLTSIGDVKYAEFVRDILNPHFDRLHLPPLTSTQLARLVRAWISAQNVAENGDFVIQNVPTTQGNKRSTRPDIVLVDTSTGRFQPNAEWGFGMHQFVQLRFGIEPSDELHINSFITHPAYYALFKRICALTGTLDQDPSELKIVYGMDSLELPPHTSSIRVDFPTQVHSTTSEKWDAVLNSIVRYHQTERPVLVLATTIAQAETLAQALREVKGITAQLLTGLQKEPEETVIQNAGQKGAVTIATNMAGRGADIILGIGVQALGGLHVIMTDISESRRIDDQSRGRAGRNGDPGSTQPLISLEDAVLRGYLHPSSAQLLAGENDNPNMEERRLAARAAQESSEIRHRALRLAQHKVFDIRFDHMRRFFNAVQGYFTINEALRNFPELSGGGEPSSSPGSLFPLVRDKVFTFWTRHMQILEDATEMLGDPGGRGWDSRVQAYKNMGEPPLREVLNLLREEAVSFYAKLTHLSPETVRKRLSPDPEGTSGEEDIPSGPALSDRSLWPAAERALRDIATLRHDAVGQVVSMIESAELPMLNALRAAYDGDINADQIHVRDLFLSALPLLFAGSKLRDLKAIVPNIYELIVREIQRRPSNPLNINISSLGGERKGPARPIEEKDPIQALRLRSQGA